MSVIKEVFLLHLSLLVLHISQVVVIELTVIYTLLEQVLE